MSHQLPYVLHVASWYPTVDRPFTGDFIQRHIEAVSPEFSGCVLHVHRLEKDSPAKWLVEHHAHYRLYLRYFSCRFRWFVPLLYTFFYFQGCIKICKQHGRPAILHVHVLNRLALVVGWLQRWLKVPLIISEHWTGYHDNRFEKLPTLQQMAMKKLALRARRILPVTVHLQRAMEEKGLIGKYAVVPNVVNTSLFQFNSLRKNFMKFKWVHVSNLRDSHKNVSGILRVFARFLRHYPGHELHIVHSDKNSSLEKYAEALQLPNQLVKFHGAMEHQQLAPFMASCQALLLFSHFENFPCVIAEAWAAGLPVVSSNVGGIREHLDKNKGELCEAGNEHSLYQSMETLFQRYSQFSHDSIRSYAVNHFSKEAVGARLAELYKSTPDNSPKNA
ncbi:MAG: glycosyltransferase [Bacteroidales bacterium]